MSYSIQYTPEIITNLKPEQIFVYGSNTAGIHGAGAARQALKWGARMGQDGFNGQTYGISTKDHSIITLPLDEIHKNVKKFLKFANQNKQFEFLVTKVGMGLAGLTIRDIGPMFFFALDYSHSNVIMPREFHQFYKLCMDL